MSLNNRLGDRREHLRFDINGQLWASLDFGERVIIRNLTSGGVLVETTLMSTLKPIRAAQVAFDDRATPISAIVRHVSPIQDAHPSNRFLVGLEFVNLSPSQQVELERLVSEWQEQSAW